MNVGETLRDRIQCASSADASCPDLSDVYFRERIVRGRDLGTETPHAQSHPSHHTSLHPSSVQLAGAGQPGGSN